MNDVEVGTARAHDLANALREGQWLAETGGHHDEKFGPIGPGFEFPQGGHAKRIGVAVEVEARDGGETDALIEFGPRLTSENFDLVSEGHQFAGEVTGVNALAATGGVTAIHEERHTVLAGLRRTGRYGRRNRDVA